MLRTCTWTHRSARLLLIQEKLDRGAAESCKSGSTWLETWMSWSFSSQHGLSPKYVSSYMHKPEILSLCWASVLPLIKVAALPRQSRPGWTAKPHWLLEGTASFQKASAGSQTCWGALRHAIAVNWLHMYPRLQKTKLIKWIPNYPPHVYMNLTGRLLPTATCRLLLLGYTMPCFTKPTALTSVWKWSCFW